MKTFLDEFRRRKIEVDQYYELLIEIEQSNRDASKEKVLKAGFFLLLYNLMEASISKSLLGILQAIYASDHTYDDLRPEIKKHLLDHVSAVNSGDFVNRYGKTRIAEAIISECVEKERYVRKVFSGNVDAKAIKVIATKYGFSVAGSDFSSIDVNKINQVKSHRNELAHGTFSYSDIGKKYSIQDLEKYKSSVISYLKLALSSIDKYIDDKGYLHSD